MENISFAFENALENIEHQGKNLITATIDRIFSFRIEVSSSSFPREMQKIIFFKMNILQKFKQMQQHATMNECDLITAF